MKRCSICKHPHGNTEPRCLDCAKKGLRPSDKIAKKTGRHKLKIDNLIDAIEFEGKITYAPNYKEE